MAKSKATKSDAKPEVFRPEYDELLDRVERKFKLARGGMSPEARRSSRISSGLLGTDLMLGGGLYSGAWYTVFGGEGSAKSTHLAHMKISAARSGIPIMADYDYEGSSQPEYYDGIIEIHSNLKKVTNLYGLDDGEGNWIIRPKVRYYNPNVAEDFFDSVASTLRRLPRKEFVENRWWYVWAPTKEGQEAARGRYSKSMYSKYKELYVEAESGLPQALYFLDSYPAMYPDNLDDDDAGRGMAAIARAMAENLPKIFSKLRSRGIIIAGANQLRLRPAVQFGCLHYDTPIHFVDGRIVPIGRVVEDKIKGSVWSLNETTGKLEPRRIKAWHNNGQVADNGWLVVKTQGINTKGGVVTATVTPNHQVYTDRGWVEARDLTVDDHVLSRYYSFMTGDRAAFVAGVLSGDSCIVGDSRSINSSLRFQDNENQDYMAWKVMQLGMPGTWHEISRGKCFVTKPSAEWAILKAQLGDRNPANLEQYITPLSLAIMYMDDGNYRAERGCVVSYKRFKGNRREQQRIQALWAKFGVNGEFSFASGTLRFTKAEAEKLYALIGKYVPQCMHYKLPVKWRRKSGFIKKFREHYEPQECWTRVLSIESAGQKHYSAHVTKAKKGLYDITVDGNHNYLAGKSANGFIVHNSPEYEPAGETLKFVSSVRIRQSAIVPPSGWPRSKTNSSLCREPSVLHEGAYDTYRFINMRAIKNKLSTPYLSAMQRVWTDDGTGRAHGFDPVFDTYRYLRDTGQMTGTIKTLKCEMFGTKKAIDFQAFKALVLQNGEQLKRTCKKLGITTNPRLRDQCFKQLANGTGTKMYFEHLKSGNSTDEE